MGTTEELRVMGMAMTTRVFRILPERSGLSVAGGRLRGLFRRWWRTIR